MISQHYYTGLGILAILFWAGTFAVARPLVEAIGPFTTISGTFLVAGLLGLILVAYRKDARKEIIKADKKYLLLAGTFFILNDLLIYLAINFASTRQQIIEVSLINYLWPSLTVILALPILKYKARPCLWLGIFLATFGIVLSSNIDGNLSLKTFLNNLEDNWLAYLCSLAGATSWALYSNLSRAWGKNVGGEVVIIFFIFAGLFLFPFRYVFNENSTWTMIVIGQFLFMAIFPTFLAFIFWDMAIKKGDLILISAISYLTPILSVLFTSLYLDLKTSHILWIACGLVVLGSIICKKSVITT